MSAVQDWAAALCLAALSAALLQYLSPGGTMEKIFRLVLGAFVLCGLLSPLAETVPAIAESIPAWSQAGAESGFAQSVDDQILQAADASLRQVIVGELYSMDMTEDGRIVINKVAVTLRASAEECGEAAGRLEKATGLKMEVTAYGG